MLEELVTAKGTLQEHVVLISEIKKALDVRGGIFAWGLHSRFLRDQAPAHFSEVGAQAFDNALQPTVHTCKELVHAGKVWEKYKG